MADAENNLFSPNDRSDWTKPPEDAAEALDELAQRVTDAEGSHVTGPASSTDNAIARFDGTTGKVIQNSGVTINDSDHLIGTGVGWRLVFGTADDDDFAVLSADHSWDMVLNGEISLIIDNAGNYDDTAKGLLNDKMLLIPGMVEANALYAPYIGGLHSGASEITLLDDVDFNAKALSNMERIITFAFGYPASKSVSTNLEWAGRVQVNASHGVVVPWDYEIIAHSCSVNITTASAGDVSAEVKVNGVRNGTGALAFTAAAGTGYKQLSDSSVGITGSAGDFLGAQMTLSSGGTMTWIDTLYCMWVKVII